MQHSDVLQALSAMDFSNGSPETTIRKYAKANSLAPDVVVKLARTYNIAKTANVQASNEDRGASFTLIDTDNLRKDYVSSDLLKEASAPMQKSASAAYVNPTHDANSINLNLLIVPERTVKAAAAPVEEATPTRAEIAAVASEEYHTLIIDVTKAASALVEEMAEESLDATGYYKVDLKDLESDLLQSFNKEATTSLVNLLENVANDLRLNPVRFTAEESAGVSKRAFAGIQFSPYLAKAAEILKNLSMANICKKAADDDEDVDWGGNEPSKPSTKDKDDDKADDKGDSDDKDPPQYGTKPEEKEITPLRADELPGYEEGADAKPEKGKGGKRVNMPGTGDGGAGTGQGGGSQQSTAKGTQELAIPGSKTKVETPEQPYISSIAGDTALAPMIPTDGILNAGEEKLQKYLKNDAAGDISEAVAGALRGGANLVNKLPDTVTGIIEQEGRKNVLQERVDTDAADIRRAVMLRRLASKDPVLKNMDKGKIESVYNSIASASPEIARDPNLLIHALREAVSYDGVPVESLRQLADTDTSLNKAREAGRKDSDASYTI